MAIQTLFALHGKVAVVTGGSGLLGRQFCNVLEAAGARVVVADLTPVDQRQSPVQPSAPKRLEIAVDVTDKQSVEAMVRRTVDECGRLDILVNNAAMTVKGGSVSHSDYFAQVEEYPLDLWDRALRVGLTGAFLCSQEAGRVMESGASIVNMCSIYGVVGPDQRLYEHTKNQYRTGGAFNTPPSYSAIKGGVLALTRYLATYWAAKGIRVNALTPGGVFDGHDQQFVDQYSARVPLGRMADAGEMAGPLLFLASPAASYVTGTNLVVDGGWTAW